MFDLSVRNKLFGGFGLVIGLFLVLLLGAYANFVKLTDARSWDRHSFEVLREADAVEGHFTQIQSDCRGFLLTGSEKYLTQLDENQTQMKRHFNALQTLTLDNPGQQQRLKQIASHTDDWLVNVIAPLLAKRRDLGKNPAAAIQMSQDPLLASGFLTGLTIRKLITDFNDEEQKLLAQRSESVEALRESMTLLLSVGALVCVLLASVVAVLLAGVALRPLGNLTDTVNKIAAGQQSARADVRSKDEFGQVATEFNRMAQAIQDSQVRELASSDELKFKVDALLAVVDKAKAGDLTGQVTVTGSDAIGRLGSGLATMFDNLRVLLNRVQKAGIQVATSSTEIAASAKQQETTGIEQAQTSIEVLSTTKEISANTSHLLKAMEEVTQVAEDTAVASVDAQANLHRMDHTMQRMVNATDAINAKLAALSEKASNINAVLTTITKVADQTNILSLNAAIEAEKAGEAGRGFSVVATEIRRLSDQTSIATWDIEKMLKEMQSAVSASVMGMDKFSEEIRRSVDETRRTGEGLTTVIAQVQKLTPRFDVVLEGMQSQAIGASQITESMTQLNDATQQAVDALRSTSEAVQQLQYAAQDLQAGVSSFAVNQ